MLLSILNSTIIVAILTVIISKKKQYEKALGFSILLCSLSLIFFILSQPSIANLTINTIGVVTYTEYILTYAKSIDSLSILFICLSTFLIIACILTSPVITYGRRLFFSMLFIIELALINVFTVTEIFYFYILFEAVLIPVFLIIGIWGSRPEKISAAYEFFIYTLFGSLFMLTSIVYIYNTVGSTNLAVVKAYQFLPMTENLLWLSFFIAFAVKIPMFPFHLWLPKAHVEAPTAGSVLLAGILLKLGSYGFVRFSIFLFPSGTEFFRPFILILALLGIVYSSFTILRQIDLKRVIAYSSVSHMNYVILGCFSESLYSVIGSILLMLSHGLVSAGLFLGVGVLYDRYHTRNLIYFRGLVMVMPVYTIMFLILLLLNIGFPPTLNFIAEFLILNTITQTNIIVGFISTIGLFYSGVVCYLVFTRIFFGDFSVTNGFNHINQFYDLSLREFCAIFPLIFFAILFGFQPGLFVQPLVFGLACWGI